MRIWIVFQESRLLLCHTIPPVNGRASAKCEVVSLKQESSLCLELIALFNNHCLFNGPLEYKVG
jgi:hypothetical protein